jgi:hypothetical protein
MRSMKAACSASTCSRVIDSPEPATDSPRSRTNTLTRSEALARLGCSLPGSAAGFMAILAGKAIAARRSRCAPLATAISRTGAAAANVDADSKALHTAHFRPCLTLVPFI